MAGNPIKMSSYGKMINKSCLRLVETVDFDIKIVLIRGHMQKLQPKTCGCIRMAGHSGNDHPGFGFLRGWPDTPGVFVRVLDFCAADFIKQPKTPSRWPLIKKRSTWKLFVSSKRSRLLLGSFPYVVVYYLKRGPQGSASLNRIVLESLDKTIPNLTRVLDVNWCNFLVRKA